MTLSHNGERRPLALGAASTTKTVRAATNEPESTPILCDPADLVNGIHVLIVAVDCPDGARYRRRFMLSLDAAEKAAARATMRGHRASIVLAHVVPVETVQGWEVAA